MLNFGGVLNCFLLERLPCKGCIVSRSVDPIYVPRIGTYAFHQPKLHAPQWFADISYMEQMMKKIFHSLYLSWSWIILIKPFLYSILIGSMYGIFKPTFAGSLSQMQDLSRYIYHIWILWDTWLVWKENGLHKLLTCTALKIFPSFHRGH